MTWLGLSFGSWSFLVWAISRRLGGAVCCSCLLYVDCVESVNFLSLLLEAVESDSGPSAPRLAEPASHMDAHIAGTLEMHCAVHLVVLLLSRRPIEAVGDYSRTSVGVDVSRPLVGFPRVSVGAVPDDLEFLGAGAGIDQVVAGGFPPLSDLT